MLLIAIGGGAYAAAVLLFKAISIGELKGMLRRKSVKGPAEPAPEG
jgi:hypothetical protein